ncbi:hypothetical protein [Geotoga petraea]|jgi:hypothetical protein|uniref:Uncharacterized protein n=1 Tax=Geotoga petraea TaxID=28234 RepID=A0A1G6Q453_9BACT|nr:hypothetical protein [Geotoga petraea]SDC87242.1 hypothetical protein SAMN04488588_1985 [Geotoga petraea]
MKINPKKDFVNTAQERCYLKYKIYNHSFYLNDLLNISIDNDFIECIYSSKSINEILFIIKEDVFKRDYGGALLDILINKSEEILIEIMGYFIKEYNITNYDYELVEYKLNNEKVCQ